MTEDEENSIIEAALWDGLAVHFRSLTPEQRSAPHAEMTEMELANRGLAASVFGRGTDLMSEIYAECDRRGIDRTQMLSLIDGLFSFYTTELTEHRTE